MWIDLKKYELVDEKMKVAVIDDEKSIRFSFETFLENDGYEVACAEDLETGLEVVQQFSPDIIFCDIVLRNDNGMDLLSLLMDLNLQVPIVMITGQPSVETAAKAVRLGAFDYLVKPVIKDDLLRVCRTAAKHRLLIEDKRRITLEKERFRKHLQTVFFSVDDPILSIDNSMRIIACNDAAYKIYCYNSSDVDYEQTVKRGALNLLEGLYLPESKHPFLRACTETIERVLENGTPIRGENTSFIDSKGNPCKLLINCLPLLDSNNTLLGVALAVKDITRIQYLENKLKASNQSMRIIGNCNAMESVFKLIKAVADTDATVIITGESGTGKSMVAKEIHSMSERASQNMVTVSCSSLVEHLLESELFGHVKGAFTGAINDKIGRFELCDKGTIFLDEIGELSPVVQAKLLTVIQDRVFEKVGDSRPVKVDTRVITATNKVMKEEVASGRFRQDLYYRLNVVEIKMPPLRERQGDVPLLVENFISKFKEKYKRNIQYVSLEVMDFFERYPWPGNVRELEHALEHCFVLCRDEVIEFHHLPLELQEYELPGDDMTQEYASEVDEKEQIISILDQTDGNKAKAARVLGVSRTTLYRKLLKYDLE